MWVNQVMTCLDFMIFHPIDKTAYETLRANRRNDLVPALLDDQGWHVDLCHSIKSALSELTDLLYRF
jgi:hypothetical protein